MEYYSDFAAKDAILDIGRRMYNKGFVAANDGNISCRVGDNAIWTTPTGVSKGFMTSEMLVKVDLLGNVLLGDLRPSSELKMHLRVYRENPELLGVTHAHPPICTAFAIAGRALDKAILTEAVLTLGEIPLAPYATPGTEEVPDSIAPFVHSHNGALLANHGALSWGRDVYEAWYRLESMEFYANILMYTDNVLRQQNLLTCTQVSDLEDIRRRNGTQSGGTLTCAECPFQGAPGHAEACSCGNHAAEQPQPAAASASQAAPTVNAATVEAIVKSVIAKLSQ